MITDFVWVFNNKGVIMEEKMQAVAKLKAIQSYINTLYEEYEDLEDTKEYDEKINAKSSILREIKNFIENL